MSEDIFIIRPTFPADRDRTWRIPNSPTLAESSHLFWFGLTLNGTASDRRIRINPELILPQAPAEVAGAPPPPFLSGEDAHQAEDENRVSGFTDFESLVPFLAASIGAPLREIVSSYAALAAFYSAKSLELRGIRSEGPSDERFFYETFQHFEVFETEKTVREYVGDLFRAVRFLRDSINLRDDQNIKWETFPTDWPPKPIDGDYKLVSAPLYIPIAFPKAKGGIEVNSIKDVVITVKLKVDTQGYQIPRGFSLDVKGVEYYNVFPDAHDPSSSMSSSSAYSGGDPSGG